VKDKTSEDKMLYDDYEGYLNKYKKEYGDNTLVLMQCGSFYELYDDGSKQTDMRAIGELLNIQVSRRNKSILEVSRSNLEMAGFPAYTLNKFLNTLVSNNFTCVIVSQTTPPPNPKREVTDIVSPGTYIEDDIAIDSNYLMSIYVEEFSEYKTNKVSIVVGASLVDLGTGRTYCFESASKSNDIHYPLDELYRIIVTYNPREIMICGKLKLQEALSSVTFDKVVSYLDVDGKCLHNDYDKLANDIFRSSYQEELLSRVYGSTGIISKVDFISLERMPCALTSFIRLLQFVHNHNENVLNKIHKPIILEASQALVLSYNSIKQLDIVPKASYGGASCRKSSGCLLDLLNNCKTSMGKRYFKERLLCPSNNIHHLKESYANIDVFISSQKKTKMLETLKGYLVNVYDLERLFRKIDLGTIQPFEIGYVMVSLQSMTKVLEELSRNNINLHVGKDVETYIADVISEVSRCFNDEELLKYNTDNISPLIFKHGHCERLDELYDELNRSKEYVYDIANKLNKLSSQEGIFKVECNERDGYYLVVTSKRYQDFVKSVKAMSVATLLKTTLCVEELETKAVSHSSSSLKVTHKTFRIISEKIDALNVKIKRLCLEEYKQVLLELSQATSQYTQQIVEVVALIDFYWCCALNALTMKYNKPMVNEGGESKSYLKAKGLRHPIIESLNKNVAYVANDVTLGQCDSACDGILLYGLNSSGKSSLMKSIGIAVLMAQAGMYVACDDFEYVPYDYIFTRIFSSDDIFKGQSTFTKEMMELRGILRRANSNSLVLGDELCSGTESISALSIVSAGIYTLSQRQSSFIFATHLHDLVTIPLVKDLHNVKTFHLSVEYDDAKRALVYDRKLKTGNGSSLYGLEVCKSLDLEQDFLDVANSVRQGILKIERDIVSYNGNKNKYNKSIYTDKCQVCGEKAQEIHHISEQRFADDDGFINGKFHKNDKFNLVCLCEKCHDNVHHGNLVINGYKQTTNGVVLEYTHNDKEEPEARASVKDTDVNATIISAIKSMLVVNNNMKRKDIILSIQQRFTDIELSPYKIDKFIKEAKRSES
jgi:DNA mismatch repair protein MutS